MKLYSYWRSSTSYRVRIALHLKGLAADIVPVNLVEGAQTSDEYVALNPIKGVPTLVTDEGAVITQSMAILDYLDHIAPDPALLPADPVDRAQALAAAMVFATDVHPVNNMKVVDRVKALTADPDAGVVWMKHWMAEGLAAYEALILRDTPFSFGDTPSLADICLVAQLHNCHRWDVDLTLYPRLTEIENRCLALPAFDKARPENQKDAT